MLSRVDEKIISELFRLISNGKTRIPLKTALNRLNDFFNSNENPYKKFMCDYSQKIITSTEEFMDEFYIRHVDKRHGIRSQILMAGGPKNLRGNPRGPMDSMLFFPQITFDQFFGIARDMECVYLDKIAPGFTSRTIFRTYDTKKLKEIQKIENNRFLNSIKLGT